MAISATQSQADHPEYLNDEQTVANAGKRIITALDKETKKETDTSEKSDSSKSKDDMTHTDVPEIDVPLSDIKVSGTDNDAGGEKTVTEQASSAMFEKIQQEIKDGKLSDDSPEAKLMRTFQAKGALEDGYDYNAYVELIESGGSTYRDADIDPTKLNAKDAAELIDSEKVDEQMISLMGDKAITDRYQSSLDETISNLPKETVDDLKKQVEAELFVDGGKEPNTNFEKSLIALYDKGDDASKDKAEKQIDTYFDTLKLLDPEAHATRRQEMNTFLMTHEIDKKMADPSLVSDEAKAASAQDVISVIKETVNGAIGAGKFGNLTDDQIKRVQSDIDTFGKKAENMAAGDLADMFDALNDNAGETDKNRLSNALDKDFNDLNDSKKENYGAFKKFATSLQSTGMLGAAGGMMSLMSGISGLTRGDMTSTEKLAAARDFIGAASQLKDFTTFGLNITNKLTNTFGSTGDQKPSEMKAWSTASQWLGLDGDNFPDIWKKPDADASGTPDSESGDPIAHQSAAAVETASGAIELQDIDADGRPVANSANLPDDAVMTELGNSTGNNKLDKDAALKAGKAFSRFVIGAGLDVTGGVLDIVTGAKKLKEADTALEKADAGLSIASGSMSTAFGLSSAISMVAPKAASMSGALAQIGNIATASRVIGIISRVASPAFAVVGGILGIIGGLISGAVVHNKLQKVTDEQGQLFKNWAKDGLAKEDWGDKLEYARYAGFMYGGREAPDDKSIYEYQKDEWEYFKDTPQKDGSSLNRIAPYLHKDHNFGEQNLFEKQMNGETSYQVGGRDRPKDNARPWSDTNLEIGAPEENSTTAFFEQKVADAFNGDWYDERSEKLGEVIKNWDNWNGKDSIVSVKDLRDIQADGGRSQSERDAATFLLEDVSFREAVDGIGSGGSPDDKISTGDMNQWLGAIGKGNVNDVLAESSAAGIDDLTGTDKSFYEENRETVDAIASHWDDWNGKDSIVSDKDLRKIAGNSKKSESERAAARFLLDNTAFFDALDGIDDSGKTDGKISSGDLRKWFQEGDIDLTI